MPVVRGDRAMSDDMQPIKGRPGPTPIPAIDRLMRRVTADAVTGCWLTTYKPMSAGYVLVGVADQGKVLGHRLTYEHYRGPIPEGLELDHLCRNRACVSPLHLEAVTRRVNMARGDHPSAITKRTNICRRGHSMADALVESRGRRCRTCRRESNRRWRDRT